jgi:hypothetical protein
VALAAISELFDERAGDDDTKPVLTLKACNRRVRRRFKELGAFAAVTPTAPASTPSKDELEALAARLPEDLPEREQWRTAVLAIGADEPDLDAIEERLRSLERRLLDSLEAQLPPPTRAAIDTKVKAALGVAAEVGEARRGLADQELRRRFGLPRLSLVG